MDVSRLFRFLDIDDAFGRTDSLYFSEPIRSDINIFTDPNIGLLRLETIAVGWNLPLDTKILLETQACQPYPLVQKGLFIQLRQTKSLLPLSSLLPAVPTE